MSEARELRVSVETEPVVKRIWIEELPNHTEFHRLFLQNADGHHVIVTPDTVTFAAGNGVAVYSLTPSTKPDIFDGFLSLWQPTGVTR